MKGKREGKGREQKGKNHVLGTWQPQRGSVLRRRRS